MLLNKEEALEASNLTNCKESKSVRFTIVSIFKSSPASFCVFRANTNGLLLLIFIKVYSSIGWIEHWTFNPKVLGSSLSVPKK